MLPKKRRFKNHKRLIENKDYYRIIVTIFSVYLCCTIIGTELVTQSIPAEFKIQLKQQIYQVHAMLSMIIGIGTVVVIYRFKNIYQNLYKQIQYHSQLSRKYQLELKQNKSTTSSSKKIS